MKTLLSIAAFTVMMGGVALAQDDEMTTQAVDPNEPDQMGLFDDPEVMGPFFTDETMTVLLPAEDVETAFLALPMEDQEALTAECENVDTIASESPELEEFCGIITAE